MGVVTQAQLGINGWRACVRIVWECVVNDDHSTARIAEAVRVGREARSIDCGSADSGTEVLADVMYVRRKVTEKCVECPEAFFSFISFINIISVVKDTGRVTHHGRYCRHAGGTNGKRVQNFLLHMMDGVRETEKGILSVCVCSLNGTTAYVTTTKWEESHFLIHLDK